MGPKITFRAHCEGLVTDKSIKNKEPKGCLIHLFTLEYIFISNLHMVHYALCELSAPHLYGVVNASRNEDGSDSWLDLLH